MFQGIEFMLYNVLIFWIDLLVCVCVCVCCVSLGGHCPNYEDEKGAEAPTVVGRGSSSALLAVQPQSTHH